MTDRNGDYADYEGNFQRHPLRARRAKNARACHTR